MVNDPGPLEHDAAPGPEGCLALTGDSIRRRLMCAGKGGRDVQVEMGGGVVWGATLYPVEAEFCLGMTRRRVILTDAQERCRHSDTLYIACSRAFPLTRCHLRPPYSQVESEANYSTGPTADGRRTHSAGYSGIGFARKSRVEMGSRILPVTCHSIAVQQPREYVT